MKKTLFILLFALLFENVFLGPSPLAQSPIPNPQSPIPNPHISNKF